LLDKKTVRIYIIDVVFEDDGIGKVIAGDFDNGELRRFGMEAPRFADPDDGQQAQGGEQQDTGDEQEAGIEKDGALDRVGCWAATSVAGIAASIASIAAASVGPMASVVLSIRKACQFSCPIDWARASSVAIWGSRENCPFRRRLMVERLIKTLSGIRSIQTKSSGPAGSVCRNPENRPAGRVLSSKFSPIHGHSMNLKAFWMYLNGF
jgi:hypothetical protein